METDDEDRRSSAERRRVSSGTAGPAPAGARGRRRALLVVAQLTVGAWLLVSPVVLDGLSALVAAKDVLAGTVLLGITATAALSPAVRQQEGRACVVVGALLIVASVSLEFGSGSHAVAGQWSEIVSGVVLVCLGAARVR